MEKKCDIHEVCDYNCKNCGHNPAEVERRKHLIETYGLKIGKDGLARLIIKKKGNEDGQIVNECDAG